MSGVTPFWTIAGDLRFDDLEEDQPKLTVNFHDWRGLTRDKKLRLLAALVEAANQQPELKEPK